MTNEIYFQDGEFSIEFPVSLPGSPGADGGYTSPSLISVVPGTTYSVPAGKTLAWLGINQAAGARTLSLGTTVSGTDIFDLETIPSNTDHQLTGGFYTSTGQTIYFSGFTGSLRVYVF